MVTHATPDGETHSLKCIEIWGGNRAINNAISTTGIDAWVYSQPHEGGERGGDVHYVSMCGSGRISRFVVADVAGHGETVDHVARMLRGLMRRHINRVDQASFARALNKEFSRLAETGQFATALLATYYSPTDHLIVCNAGHPRPLLRRASDGEWRALDHTMEGALTDRDSAAADLPLGVIEPTDYRQFAVPMEVGDEVLIYTDALNEARREGGRMLGEEGLLGLVQKIETDDAGRFIPELLDRVQEARGGEAAQDDVTALLLRHNGAEPPSLSLGERMRIVGRLLGLSAA